MGMVRCNVPSMFLYGGSALPGSLNGRDLLDDVARVLARHP
jgi:dihydroxy-acid dehydratase